MYSVCEKMHFNILDLKKVKHKLFFVVHQLPINHHERLCFFKLSESVRMLEWFGFGFTHPEGTRRANVIKCHFAVRSADMEKLLFPSSPL